MKRGEPLTREVCVRMTEAEYQRLDREACRRGRSKPELTRRFIDTGLDREDTHRMQEAMSRG